MTTSQLTFDTLRVAQKGRVLTVEVDDPPYNYMTATMQEDLDRLTRAVDEDPSIGAVVLTGGVPGRYITHFDISAILAAAEGSGSRGHVISSSVLAAALRGVQAASQIPPLARAIDETRLGGLLNVSRFNDVVLRIMRSPAVWIAAIDGPCGGGGLEISVCFDVRTASEEAAFLLPELLIGLTTTVGAQRLVQLVGPGRALELVLEGRAYSAEEALGMGLIGSVVSRDALLEHAHNMARRYARRNRRTIAAQKRVFNEFTLLPPAKSLRREGATNTEDILNGPARRALKEWVRQQDQLDGESVFVADPQPWVEGTAVDLTH